MCSETVLSLHNIDKRFEIYSRPLDRLRQLFSNKNDKKFYKEFWALKGISFNVKQGETLGIIGDNGAGKSTLLEIIASTLEPTNGTITRNRKVAALLELGAGFNPEFTGRENIHINASIMGLNNIQIAEAIEKIIIFSELSEFIDQPVRTYSSGMYVRLAFSILMEIKAEILIIDEALAVGDIKFVQKCMRYLDEFKKTGTLILVSHDLPTIVKLCDRAIWLNKGELKEIGSAKNVTEAYLAGLFGSENSGGKGSEGEKAEPDKDLESFIDQRQSFINHSNLRNDIKVFQFDQNHKSFGTKGIEIENVHLVDELGGHLSWVVGGELVHLEIFCRALDDIKQPIIGFYFKDKLGQNLFGDNSYLSYLDAEIQVKSQEKFSGSFVFRMPTLPAGEYSIAVAAAEGTQKEHTQHHWIHDAILLQSITTSNVFGLVGVPMSKVELKL